MNSANSGTKCRRCLLRDLTDENDYHASVTRYRASLPAKKRTPDAEYEQRLAVCQGCQNLDSGTCMQCGCYVEMRAARSDMHCPLGQQRW